MVLRTGDLCMLVVGGRSRLAFFQLDAVERSSVRSGSGRDGLRDSLRAYVLQLPGRVHVYESTCCRLLHLLVIGLIVSTSISATGCGLVSIARTVFRGLCVLRRAGHLLGSVLLNIE